MKLEFPTKKTVDWSKSSSRTAILYNEFIQVSLVANVVAPNGAIIMRQP